MELSLESRPKLRWPIDIEHSEYNGEKIVILRDQREVASKPAVFFAALLPIIARFDGRKTIRAIAEEGAPYGITAELVITLARELTEFHFLETPETNTRWEQIKEEFRNQSKRRAAHADVIYPADEQQLRKTLDEYIQKSDRNGIVRDDTRPIVGIIAPHIDYHRGWQTYGASYTVMREIERPDVIFLFGTAHQPGSGIFHLTRKPFCSPLGTFPAALDVINSIGAAYGERRSFQDEILHKKEHSLELQLPFLAHRYSGEALPALVPILVGSFQQCFFSARKPLEIAEISDFIEILAVQARQLRNSGRRVLFYGGVDFAHVGLHFGDQKRVSDNGLEELAKRDSELIESILSADESRLFEHIAEDRDERRVCGFPSMFTMFAALRRAGISVQGKLIEYRQAVEPKSDCVVTFASACWFEQ